MKGPSNSLARRRGIMGHSRFTLHSAVFKEILFRDNTLLKLAKDILDFKQINIFLNKLINL